MSVQTGTYNGYTLKWNGTAIGKVVSFDIDDSFNPVDCSHLGSAQADNREGMSNPSGSITVSLIDGAPSITKGASGKITVDDGTAWWGTDQKFLVTGISGGGGVDEHAVVTINLVSTEKPVVGGGGT